LPGCSTSVALLHDKVIGDGSFKKTLLNKFELKDHADNSPPVLVKPPEIFGPLANT
jgi:hypothetical protein